MLNICYIGSGPFAARVLELLVKDARFTIEMVVTQPHAPSGRKKTLTPTPVFSLAKTLGFPLGPKNSNFAAVKNRLLGMRLAMNTFSFIWRSKLSKKKKLEKIYGTRRRKGFLGAPLAGARCRRLQKD